MADGCVPHFNLELTPHSLENLSCMLKTLRPEWKSSDLQFQFFSDGITNNLIRAHVGPEPSESALIRIYGKSTDKIINREKELTLLKALQSSKLGPALYATFLNGIVYEYFPGKTLDQESIYSELVFPLVAQKMARLHQQISNCSSIFDVNHSVIWGKIESFLAHSLESAPSRTITSPELNFSYDGSVDYSVDIPLKSKLWEEVSWLRKAVQPLESPLVLCHNDLLLANVLYDESRGTVQLIDFEYAGPNYQAYDIANHFNEYASGVDSFDSSLYPGEDFQRQWLSFYLRAFFNEEDGKEADDEKTVSKLLKEINWFRLVSHLFCGTWGLFQIAHSALVFDFHGYTHCRLQEYFKLKRRLLGA